MIILFFFMIFFTFMIALAIGIPILITKFVLKTIDNHNENKKKARAGEEVAILQNEIERIKREHAAEKKISQGE